MDLAMGKARAAAFRPPAFTARSISCIAFLACSSVSWIFINYAKETDFIVPPSLYQIFTVPPVEFFQTE